MRVSRNILLSQLGKELKDLGINYDEKETAKIGKVKIITYYKNKESVAMYNQNYKELQYI